MSTVSQEGDKKPRFRILQFILFLVAVIAVGVFAYLTFTSDRGCDWTGLGECRSSSQPGEQVRLAKTLWDWLQILVVPIALAVTGFILNRALHRREQQSAENRAQLERQIAEDRLREDSLQSYLDTMSDLLLERNLRNSHESDEVRAVARSKSLTVLRRLDGHRRSVLVRFLKESDLIETANLIIDLDGAELDGCNLELVDMHGCSLEGARMRDSQMSQCLLADSNLTRANLSNCELRSADLRNAHLFAAILDSADLTNCDLRGADLRFASLRDAGLTHAKLQGAKLTQADVGNADFTNATISMEQLKVCRSLEDAIVAGIQSGRDKGEASAKASNL